MLQYMAKTPVLLQFNCGFARCAVKEITAEPAAGKKGKSARIIDNKLRAEKFKKILNLPSFGISNGFNEATTTK